VYGNSDEVKASASPKPFLSQSWAAAMDMNQLVPHPTKATLSPLRGIFPETDGVRSITRCHISGWENTSE
jgi:hypothetical protein